jgi:hypothetical protein
MDNRKELALKKISYNTTIGIHNESSALYHLQKCNIVYLEAPKSSRGWAMLIYDHRDDLNRQLRYETYFCNISLIEKELFKYYEKLKYIHGNKNYYFKNELLKKYQEWKAHLLTVSVKAL